MKWFLSLEKKKKRKKKRKIMSRKDRKEKQAAQENPINVTVMEDGIRKVIPYKEYKKKYLNSPKEEEEDN